MRDSYAKILKNKLGWAANSEIDKNAMLSLSPFSPSMTADPALHSVAFGQGDQESREMDAIRKKMQSLKSETYGLYAIIEGFEKATKESAAKADQVHFKPMPF